MAIYLTGFAARASYSPSFDDPYPDPDKSAAQAARATTAATVSTAGGEGGTIIRIGKSHIHVDDGVMVVWSWH